MERPPLLDDAQTLLCSAEDEVMARHFARDEQVRAGSSADAYSTAARSAMMLVGTASPLGQAGQLVHGRGSHADSGPPSLCLEWLRPKGLFTTPRAPTHVSGIGCRLSLQNGSRDVPRMKAKPE